VAIGIRLWRSASPGGAFTKVYEGASVGANSPGVFTVLAGRIWFQGLWSDDDGASWNAVPRWR
jgi:hypothetical protein